MDPEFPRQIHDEARKLFPEGAIQILMGRMPGPDAGPSAAVKLIHNATGIEEICDKFSTQIQNFTAAAIRWRVACDGHSGKQDAEPAS